MLAAIQKAERPPDNPDELARRYEQRLAGEVLRAFDALQRSFKTGLATSQIATGNAAPLITLVDHWINQVLAAVITVLEDLMFDAAVMEAPRIERAATKQPPPPGAVTPLRLERDRQRFSVYFDRLDPRLIEFLRRYRLDLIREIGDETREAIRERLIAGMQAGENPRDTAREVRKVIGLTKRQAAAVGKFRKELERFHERTSANTWNLGGKISRAPGGAQTFAVDAEGNPVDAIFERRLRDFRYDPTLIKTLKTGKPLSQEQIDKMVAAYTRKYLRYRSETIARTEALRAANAGTLMAWRQAEARGVVPAGSVRKRWVTSKDERLCRICKPMPKLNAGPEGRGIPLEQFFVTPKGAQIMTPGAHPDCRCYQTMSVVIA